MKKISISPIICTFVLLMFNLPGFGQALTFKDVGTVDFPHTVFNDCTGEDVEFTGVVHYSDHGTITPSGNALVHFHFNFSNMTGTGVDSGIKYQCVTAYNEKFNETAGLAASIHITQNMIAQGNNPSLIFDIDGVFVVNPNGEVTVDFFNVTIGCH
ncbi:MAG: hypothetical protein OEM26_08875 [Saprospiraceae bacterium]|nr:hypothetical protein [Saprospiraceae bacterium]